MPREVSAGAIVFRTTKNGPHYLLLHHTEGHWDFPKGNMEKGEEEKDTVRREIEEETGIKRIRFIDGFRETIKYSYKSKGEKIFKVVVFYLVRSSQKNVKISYEHKGFAWLQYDDALARVTFKNSKKILKKARGKLGETE